MVNRTCSNQAVARKSHKKSGATYKNVEADDLRPAKRSFSRKTANSKP